MNFSFPAVSWRIDRLNEEILHSMIYGQIENLSGNTSYNFQIDTVNHTRAMSESMIPTLKVIEPMKFPIPKFY